MARRPVCRDEQPDLFDLPVREASAPQATGAAAPEVDPSQLDDAELCARFPEAGLQNLNAMAAQLLQRRPPKWQASILGLWDRFAGFGRDKPCPEQILVLEMIRHAGGAAAREMLRALLARDNVYPCLDASLVRAAAASGVPLRAARVAPCLSGPDPDLRQAALEIATPSGLLVEDLRPLLHDRDAAVRRLAAIVLAEVGDVAVRDMLVQLLRRQPCLRGLEALVNLADEDVVIRLGQIARTHPDWCAAIRELLEGIDHPKAAVVLAALPTTA